MDECDCNTVYRSNMVNLFVLPFVASVVLHVLLDCNVDVDIEGGAAPWGWRHNKK